MKLFQSINNYLSSKKTIITIGTFDGIHIGHRKILNKIIQSAHEVNCESLVLTFFPHPRMILQEDSTVKLLNSMDEKIGLLQEIGIDNLIIHPFDKEFSQLTAEKFVKNILVDKLQIQKIIIGYDHRFGKNRTADINDLLHFGKKYRFEVEQISAQEIDAIAVSSTKIRNALAAGTISLANEYLGYNYYFSGIVVKGNQLGRTIGFPTANILIKEDYKLIPKKGVYLVKSIIKGDLVYGIMNIGIRPTLNGTNQTIEVHYLDFNEDLYEQQLTVEVLEFIRAEQKFDSLEILKNQIQKDKEKSLTFILKEGK